MTRTKAIQSHEKFAVSFPDHSCVIIYLGCCRMPRIAILQRFKQLTNQRTYVK